MKKATCLLIAGLTLNCSTGRGAADSSPDDAYVGSYRISASVESNTCGPEGEVAAADGMLLKLSRAGDAYTIRTGGGSSIPATIEDNHLHASDTLTESYFTGVSTYDFDFANDLQSFSGTYTIEIQSTAGESCTTKERFDGHR